MTPARITLLIFLVTLISLALFILIIAILVFIVRKPLRKYKRLDIAVFDRIQPWAGPHRNKFMLFITFLGNHKFLIPANLFVILYYLLATHQTWFSIRVLTIALSSLVLMLILKALFRRKRPLSPLLKAAKGLSFPSGHSIMAVTFYGLLFYILNHTMDQEGLRAVVLILLIMLILLIGFSRIYLRVHYTSDVLAGFIIGLLWLSISLSVLARVETYVRDYVAR